MQCPAVSCKFDNFSSVTAAGHTRSEHALVEPPGWDWTICQGICCCLQMAKPHLRPCFIMKRTFGPRVPDRLHQLKADHTRHLSSFHHIRDLWCSPQGPLSIWTSSLPHISCGRRWRIFWRPKLWWNWQHCDLPHLRTSSYHEQFVL